MPQTKTRRLLSRLLALLAAFALVAAACSNDDDAGEDTTTEESTPADDAADDAEEPTDDAEEPAEDAADDAADDAEEPAEDAADAPADAIPVSLSEWVVDTESSFNAGTLTFAVTSDGENPHALAVARGTSYEELPQKEENGAVDIEALGDDFLGTTDNLEPGGSATIDFDLEAGDYVFFCPIEFGPNSHAAAGQVLSVSVS